MLFDMDNTLFDFVHAKIFACTSIVEHLGKGDAHELFNYFRREIHGFENVKNISDYLRDNSCFSQDIFLDCCRIYEEEKVRSVELYPGVKNTLLELRSKNILLGLLTDAEMRNARARLEKVGLYPLFDSLFTYDITGWKKPSHKTFVHALDSMGLKPHETLFVGDSLRRDIAPSKQLGMMAAYAVYGDRNSDRDRAPIKEKPDHILNSFSDLLRVVMDGKE
ncbi:MAG: HAD family hydrolase [Methanolobus sp.]|nr:HAD family hydrolase [Methanolobus sp.]MDP2216185.1 HAD family hydrolase [Methanolobus sp.]